MIKNINIIYYFILSGFSVLLTQAQQIEVDTLEGRVKGKTFLTVDENKECYAFQGIPYAETPVRFEKPVPKKPWVGTIDCTYDKPSCVQGSGPVRGIEDCLTLSVYSTDLSASTDVLFFIHGGGFTGGDGSYEKNGVDYLVNRGLVVILIQYRLGIFGFISTSDLICPGNNGMKDQALALDWARRNIHFFGGNPNRITLGGVSAGAASVGYHMLSPLSQGKFRGAMLNSGVPQCHWSLNRNAKRIAYKTGESFGIFTDQSSVLISCLKNISCDELQVHSYAVGSAVMAENFLIGLQFGVVSEVPHDGAFFSGRADEMFRTGNFYSVPVLAGFTTNELAGFANPNNLAIYTTLASNLDLRPWNIAPASLTTVQDDREIASYKIKYKFFGNSFALITPCVPQSIKFANIDLFQKPIDRFIKDMRQFQLGTYYYVFSYEGALGGVTWRGLPGTQHGEEQGYFWKRSIQNVPAADIEMRKMMVTLVTNFVKYLEPIPQPSSDLQNVQWQPALSWNPPFLMNINSSLGRTDNPDQNFITFYEQQIFGVFGQGYYNTY